MTAVLPQPVHLRTVAERAYGARPITCQCGTVLRSLLDECANPACIKAANDFDRALRHLEEGND